MRLLTWNTRAGGGKTRRPRQIDEIATLDADVVALQEVTRGSVDAYREGLQRIGLEFVLDSFGLAPEHQVLVRARRYGQVIASRWPLTAIAPAEFNVPWQERVLSCLVDVPTLGRVELHNTHVPPGSSNGWIKIEHMEGLWSRLATACAVPRVLMGDFNTPQAEHADGTVQTWGTGPGRDDRWDEGERRVLLGLAEHDLPDVFRAIHGYSKSEFSIVMRGNPRRYDHVFASRSLRPTSAEYVHRLREEGLSDHAPLLVEFVPA